MRQYVRLQRVLNVGILHVVEVRAVLDDKLYHLRGDGRQLDFLGIDVVLLFEHVLKQDAHVHYPRVDLVGLGVVGHDAQLRGRSVYHHVFILIIIN